MKCKIKCKICVSLENKDVLQIYCIIFIVPKKLIYFPKSINAWNCVSGTHVRTIRAKLQTEKETERERNRVYLKGEGFCRWVRVDA